MLIPQKNIFYTLFDRRVSADRVHNVDRKNKKRETFVSRFSYPFNVTMYWVLRICNAYLAALCSVYVQHFCRKIGG